MIVYVYYHSKLPLLSTLFSMGKFHFTTFLRLHEMRKKFRALLEALILSKAAEELLQRIHSANANIKYMSLYPMNPYHILLSIDIN